MHVVAAGRIMVVMAGGDRTVLPRKRSRRAANRAARDTIVARRGHRTRVIILGVIAAFATLALLIAGFFSYATPTR
jgi:hypothetical protein